MTRNPLALGIFIITTTVAGCTAPGRTHSEPEKAETWLTWLITNESGNPVSHAEGYWILDARPARDEATAHRQRADGTSDSMGNLRLPSPPKGMEGYFSVWVVSETEGVVCLDEGLYDGTEWNIEPFYALTPCDRWFAFKVTDIAGRRTPGVTGQLCRSAEGAPLPLLPALHGDNEGLIEAGPFDYGNYWVDLEAPGKAPIRACPYQFSEEDAAKFWYGPIVLPPGKAVQGRVTMDDHEPPEGAWLRCTYASTVPNETCSWFVPLARDGTFEVIVRADVPWTLAAGAPGCEEVSLRFTRESEVRLELSPAH